MPNSSVTVDDPVSIRDVLDRCIFLLQDATPNPTVEAEILLSETLGLSRSQLYLEASRDLAPAHVERIIAMAGRRAAGEPLQYVTGYQYFRRLRLQVGEGVLVPRPETEMLVEICLRSLEGISHPLVADLGTGSGAIALSIAAESGATVYASDVSPDALAWAERNLEAYPQLAERVTLRRGDLFDALPEELVGRFDLVVSNPPYLTETELQSSPVDVRLWEPETATVSGPKGHEIIYRILHEAPRWLTSSGRIALELDPRRVAFTERAMKDAFEEVTIVDDLAGRPRIALGRISV